MRTNPNYTHRILISRKDYDALVRCFQPWLMITFRKMSKTWCMYGVLVYCTLDQYNALEERLAFARDN